MDSLQYDAGRSLLAKNMFRYKPFEHLIEDERFIDSSARYKLMPELIALFDEALSRKSRDEWGEIFDQAGLIWGPVLSLDEVPQDPHALELGMFPEIEHPQWAITRRLIFQ